MWVIDVKTLILSVLCHSFPIQQVNAGTSVVKTNFRAMAAVSENERAKLHSKCENPPEGGFPNRFFAGLKRFR